MRSERKSVANMIRRSGKRLSHAAPHSKQVADWWAQGIRSFKISENQVILHNHSEVSPIRCEQGSLRSRLHAETRVIFEKTGVSCQALVSA